MVVVNDLCDDTRVVLNDRDARLHTCRRVHDNTSFKRLKN